MADLLTPEEVAARLRVTPAAVRKWCRSGALPASRAGKLWRIAESDLVVYLARREKQDTKERDSAVPAAESLLAALV